MFVNTYEAEKKLNQKNNHKQKLENTNSFIICIRDIQLYLYKYSVPGKHEHE